METNEERADALFEQALTYADDAASLSNAAGYNVAIQTLKWAATVLNPAKYGKPISDGQGNVAGYIIETGIRRAGDPGHQGGDVQNGQEIGAGQGFPSENADLGGQEHANGVDLD